MYYNSFMNVYRDGNWLHIECDENTTLQEFCERAYLPVRKVNQMIQLKKCLLDQKHCMMSDSLEHKTLSLCLFEEEEIDFACDENVAEVLYEDEYVLVVNKPSGIIIHEDDKTKTGTLNNYVAAYYQKTGQKHAVRPVHRLDKETCGCVLYCKCPWIQPYFDAAIEKKEIHRTYLAFVKGLPDFRSRTVKLPIGKDRHENGKMRIAKTGKEAITQMECVHVDRKRRVSVLKCVLETGRTHQIRLHASALKLPIINDVLYGCKEPTVKSMGLCAWKLKWNTPFTGVIQSAEASIPEDLKQFAAKGEV